MEMRKTEDLLNSLDGVKKVQAPDFFYTRLKARMEREADSPVRKPRWFLRPAYVVASLVVILAVNTFVLLNNRGSETTTVADDTETAQQTIAGDFSLADNNIIYDLNQEK